MYAIRSYYAFDIASENYTKEVKDLNNFLIKNIDTMKTEIEDFVQKNTGIGIRQSSVRKMINTITNLSSWSSDSSNRNEDIKISDDKLYNIINFYKNGVITSYSIHYTKLYDIILANIFLQLICVIL